MDAKMLVYFNQQMHIVRHDFHLNEAKTSFLTNLLNQRFEASIHSIDQDLSAVFWTPNHMIFARIDHIAITLIVHAIIIPHGGV